MTRSKVKSRSHHDVAHLHPLTNVPTKHQLPIPYGCQDTARTRFYRSRSLQQGQRSNHDVAHLHPLTNVPTKYQLPTPYSFRDIARTSFYRSRSLRQGQSLNQGHTVMLHTNTPNQCLYQVSTPYTLGFPRYSPDNILKLKVTTARSKVKTRSDHDVAHLYLLTNVPTTYQLSTPYSL